jgi:hypothetical protein
MVFSEHQVVRVVVADTFSMQSPDGQRSSAIVMGREGGQIDLVEQDGHICSLRLVLDQSFPSPDEELDVFSRTDMGHALNRSNAMRRQGSPIPPG